MQIRVQTLHIAAKLPTQAKPGDAGFDLYAVSKEWDSNNQVVVYGTGIAIEIPEGHVGLIFPRSSIFKTPLILSNSVGVIDSGYRGEIKFMFRPEGRPRKSYEVGDRIGQIVVMPYPKVEYVMSDELSITDRGTGGFGSSGT